MTIDIGRFSSSDAETPADTPAEEQKTPEWSTAQPKSFHQK